MEDSTAEYSWDDIRNFFVCKVCCKLVEEAVTLPCFHTYCKECVLMMDTCRFCKNIKLPLTKFSSFENEVISKCSRLLQERDKTLAIPCGTCKNRASICRKCFTIGCYSEHCIGAQRYSNGCNHETSNINLNRVSPIAFFNVATNDEVQNSSTISQDLVPRNNRFVTDLMKLIPFCKDLESMKCEVTKNREELLKEQTEEIEKIEVYESKLFHSLQQECQMLKLKVNAYYQCLISNKLMSNNKQIDVLLNEIKNYKIYATLLIYVANSDEASKLQQEPMGIGHRIGCIKTHIEELSKKVKVKVESQKIAPSRRVHQLSSCGEYSTEVSGNHRSSPKISMKIISNSREPSKKEDSNKNFQFNVLLISGKWYSLGTLPLASSELVAKEKANFAIILSLNDCICQLNLFLRISSQVKSCYNEKMTNIAKHYKCNVTRISQELWSLSKDIINNFSAAMMYLQLNDVEGYFDAIKKNFEKLEIFTKDVYNCLKGFKEQVLLLRNSLLSIYLPYLNEILNDTEMQLLPTLTTFCNMLLDISVQIINYTGEIYQICKELMKFRTLFGDRLIHVISVSLSFTRSTVLHYAAWIAIKELCSIVHFHHT